jgi:AcrR family transcriptional regulator
MSKNAPSKLKRSRLNPVHREQMILDGAVEFFSEVGPSGQTRELAKRLGITQSLVYRYFRDKEDLLNRVYLRVFEDKWPVSWEARFRNRADNIRKRLIEFYTNYSAIVYSKEWVRLYLLAGLQQDQVQRKFRARVRQIIYPVIIDELRNWFGIDDALGDLRYAKEEEELLITLHGMIFYVGIRKWIYQMDIPDEASGKIQVFVDMFLFSIAKLYQDSNQAIDVGAHVKSFQA